MSLPQPYYQRGPVTIWHGDCLELLVTLATDAVDITVSSPPYNMIPKTAPSGIYKEHNHKLNRGYVSHSDDMEQDEYEEWQRKVFGDCLRVSRGLVWINHKTKFEDRAARHPIRFYPWDLFCEIIWDRGVSLTLNANRYAPCHEFILSFGLPHFWDRRNDTRLTVWRINPERGIPDHPCPFPVEIPRRCIESSCPPDGIVLDPFLGSGTTAVAAIRTGRQCIGIELEEKYCEIAARRCDRELDQVRLPFDDPPHRVETQQQLFAGAEK